MTDEKIYTPTVIEDNPLPTQIDFSVVSSGSTTNQVYSAQKTTDSNFPKSNYSKETLSQSLNTKTKKILGSYKFTKGGSMQVGEYVEGESGEIKISPDGIVAKNKNGENTFTVDGDTGDVVVKGTIQAGDVQIIDEKGLVSLSSFSSITVDVQSDTTTKNALELDQWDDLSNATISFSLDRDTNYLVCFTANAKNTSAANGDAAIFRFLLDSNRVGVELVESGHDGGGVVTLQTTSAFFILTIPSGNHTLKVQFGTSGAGTSEVSATYPLSSKFSVIKLGG